MIYTYFKTYGNNILFRYIDEHGVPHAKKINNFKPTLYDYARGKTDFKSIMGASLSPRKFESINEAKDYVSTYKNMEGFEVEGNSNYAHQFVVELYNGQMPDYKVDQIRGCILDIEVNAPRGSGFPHAHLAEHPINAITFYDTLAGDYTTYAMDDWDKSKSPPEVKNLPVKYYRFDNEKDLLRSLVRHISDRQYVFTSGWNSQSFDMPYIVNRCNAILGENITKMLSPFRRISFKETTDDWGGMTQVVDIVGLPHLDYMLLYKKHIFVPRESYSLDFIGNVEVGAHKLSHEEASSLSELAEVNHQLFVDYNIVDVDIIRQLDEKLGLFAVTFTLSYYALSNYEDTLGTTKVWEQLIAKYLYSNSIAPRFKKEKNVARPFPGGYVMAPHTGFIKWLMSLDLNSQYPHLEMQMNIGPETYRSIEDVEALACENASSTEVMNYVTSGRFRAEVESYKSTMFNPDTKVFNCDRFINGEDFGTLAKMNKELNLSMSASYSFYDNSKMSFFSAIKREIYANRKIYKKKMLGIEQQIEDVKPGGDTTQILKELNALQSKFNNLQMAMKILLNSGYGALGSAYFLYFKVENAEAITSTGQLVNKWTSTRVNALLKKLTKTDKEFWVAGDTDSSYLTLEAVKDILASPEDDTDTIVNKIDNFSNTVLAPQIRRYTNDLKEYLNHYENMMIWEREVIAESCIYVAKKRYTMLVNDSEGVRFGNPYHKITGLESKKSSTPQWSKDALVECYKFALQQDKDGLHKKVIDTKTEFMKMSITDISIPRGVNNIEKWTDGAHGYISRTPKQVKASINHNALVEKLGLTDIYPIVSGIKIKYVQLKKPNPIGEEVIAFEKYFPEEFGLTKYIDKNRIFEDAFITPLQNFLDVINWQTEKTINLADFFS